MEVAYGQNKVQQAQINSEARKRLSNNWDEDLLTLHKRGWKLQFDPETYPIEIQPPAFGRTTARKPRGFFDHLLAARLWITAEESVIGEIAATIEPEISNAALITEEVLHPLELDGSQVRNLRIKKCWSQRKLASMTGISQGLISLIENGERNITPENAAVLQKILA